MIKVYLYACIAILLFSCNINQKMSSTDSRIVTSIESFASKEDLIHSFTNRWTGVIDTASSVRQSDEVFFLIHNSCSGIYCPSFYVYKHGQLKNSSWNLVFTEELTRDNGDKTFEPKNIAVNDQTIDLLNWDQVIVKSYLINSIIK